MYKLVGSTNVYQFRDQNVFRDQGSTFWVKVWDQLRKNISRYDPVMRYLPQQRLLMKNALNCTPFLAVLITR